MSNQRSHTLEVITQKRCQLIPILFEKTSSIYQFVFIHINGLNVTSVGEERTKKRKEGNQVSSAVAVEYTYVLMPIGTVP